MSFGWALAVLVLNRWVLLRQCYQLISSHNFLPNNEETVCTLIGMSCPTAALLKNSLLFFYKVEGKVKLSRYCHAGAKGLMSKLILILDLSTRWGWVVSITPRKRLPPEKDTSTHWIGGWLDVTASLNTEARGKILCLYRGSNPGRPVYSQTLY
jgi:hypothetical protein